MNRKRWSIIALGVLAAVVTFIVGWTWHGASSRGESMDEIWHDLRHAHGIGDFFSVLTGEKLRQRRLRRIEMELVVAERRKAVAVLRLLAAAEKVPGKADAAPTTAPMFGGTPQRNMVNPIDKNVPIDWCCEEGKFKNVKWSVELGSYTYTSPIIADGKVFIGTNNKNPRDPKVKDPDKAVLMAFDQATGKFLWQLVHDMSDASEYRNFGLVCSPIVEGKKLYYLTPGCIVVCASTDGKVLWTFDMMKELKVFPHHCSASSPLIVGDLLMVVTGNGVDEAGDVKSPKAPSFVAFDKNTGKVAWQSNLPGSLIIEGQYSNPTLATVNGKPQIIFPGGDCVLYSFEPKSGELIWKCDCNPGRKGKRMDGSQIENYITATPVVVGDRLYVGLGPMPDSHAAKKVSYFLCLDITKKGDVSPKSYDAKDPANKDSALVWSFGGPIVPAPKKGRLVTGYICGTAAVADGLVYFNEFSGYLHCLDAKTGQQYWDHDYKASIWGSPYVVDGKVYNATEEGEMIIFEHGKAKNLLAAVGMDNPMYGTPVVAGGVLYVSTKTKLFAIGK